MIATICTGFLFASAALGQDQPGHPEPGVAAVVSGQVITTDAVIKHGGIPLIQAAQEAHQRKLDALIAEWTSPLQAPH